MLKGISLGIFLGVAAGNILSAGGIESLVIPPAGTPANRGYKLFMLNCAHCHGADARGDEGPDLHGLDISDQGIVSRIRQGKAGEMTAFAGKLQPSEINMLVAYLRSLKP